VVDKVTLPGYPSRFVLEGVRRVHFFEGGPRCPEDVCYPSCVAACLEYLGEDLGCKEISAHGETWRLDWGYTFFMGVSGSAFRLSWRDGWHKDNVEIMYMSDDPAAPFVKPFEAVGYDHEILLPASGRDNRAYFLERIKQSLAGERRPVIAFGIIGPPESCIVTGYDEGGDVLIGWNFFQGMPEFSAGVEFEPSGYFRKRDWFRGTDDSFVIIGDKAQPPLRHDVYRRAMEWGLKVLRTREVSMYDGPRHSGLSAFDAWAERIAREEEFDTEDFSALRQRHSVHDDAIGTVAEGRWYAAQFLKRMADDEQAMRPQLLAAAACFEAEHDLMWKVWGLGGGNGRSDNHIRQFAKPEARRAMAPIILAARDKDAEAACHIEKALSLQESIKPADICDQ
jgi:hypothetical protein